MSRADTRSRPEMDEWQPFYDFSGTAAAQSLFSPLQTAISYLEFAALGRPSSKAGSLSALLGLLQERLIQWMELPGLGRDLRSPFLTITFMRDSAVLQRAAVTSRWSYSCWEFSWVPPGRCVMSAFDWCREAFDGSSRLVDAVALSELNQCRLRAVLVGSMPPTLPLTK